MSTASTADAAGSGAGARALDEARIARARALPAAARARQTFVVGAIVVAFWVFCAIFAGLVAPYDPIFDNEFPLDAWRRRRAHPFGTDSNGRDVFSRVLAGSRDMLVDRPRGDAARHVARHDRSA